MTEEKDWLKLEDYIHFLLDEGKRSGHSDFHILFKIYGKDKIVEMAKKYLESRKNAVTNIEKEQ